MFRSSFSTVHRPHSPWPPTAPSPKADFLFVDESSPVCRCACHLLPHLRQVSSKVVSHLVVGLFPPTRFLPATATTQATVQTLDLELVRVAAGSNAQCDATHVDVSTRH